MGETPRAYEEEGKVTFIGRGKTENKKLKLMEHA